MESDDIANLVAQIGDMNVPGQRPRLWNLARRLTADVDRVPLETFQEQYRVVRQRNGFHSETFI